MGAAPTIELMKTTALALFAFALAACTTPEGEPNPAPTALEAPPACEPPGSPLAPQVSRATVFGICSPEVVDAPAWNSGVGFAVCVCCGGDLCDWRLLDCDGVDAAYCTERDIAPPRCDVCEPLP